MLHLSAGIEDKARRGIPGDPDQIAVVTGLHPDGTGIGKCGNGLRVGMIVVAQVKSTGGSGKQKDRSKGRGDSGAFSFCVYSSHSKSSHL